MPTPAHTQAAALDKFIAGWKKWTPEDMTSTWSDDCTQKMLPLSLGIPAQSLSEVRTVLRSLMGILKNYKMEVREIVHDAPRSKAVIYMTSHSDTPFGDFKWTNEYDVFVSFTEDGEQINKMEEMVDMAFYQEFFPKFQKYLSEQGASH